MSDSRSEFALLEFPFHIHYLPFAENELKHTNDLSIGRFAILARPPTPVQNQEYGYEELQLGMKAVVRNPIEAANHLVAAIERLSYYPKGRALNFLALAHMRCEAYYLQSNQPEYAARHRQLGGQRCLEALDLLSLIPVKEIKASAVEFLQQQTQLSLACTYYVMARLAMGAGNNIEVLQCYKQSLVNIELAKAENYQLHYVRLKIQYIQLLSQADDLECRAVASGDGEEKTSSSSASQKSVKANLEVIRLVEELEKAHFPLLKKQTTLAKLIGYVREQFVLKGDAKYGGKLAVDFFEMYADYLSKYKLVPPAVIKEYYQAAYQISAEIFGMMHDRCIALKGKMSDIIVNPIVIPKTTIKSFEPTFQKPAETKKVQENFEPVSVQGAATDKIKMVPQFKATATISNFFTKLFAGSKEQKQSLINSQSKGPSHGYGGLSDS